MKTILPLFLLLGFAAGAVEQRPHRWVWLFGWNLGDDADVAAVERVLDRGAAHGINGAVASFGLDTLCKKKPDYFVRLEKIRTICARNGQEFVPAVFSVGYGGTALSHNRHLAEGLPVENAPFRVTGAEARLVPDDTVALKNGGFEDFSANKFKGYNFHDQPGEVSFADTQVKHGGDASLRMENFKSNPHGHGRVMQELRVRPHRCYRVTAWVKTKNLQPASSFRVQVLAGNRSLSPREFNLQPTADWRKITMIFNSANEETVRLYAGTWGAREGAFWIDDWTVGEVGPINVLRRPGTPVVVTSDDGSATYEEGRDYAPLVSLDFNPYRVDVEPAALKILPGGRIRDGQALRVSWYHPMLIHDSQVTVCMAEPELYEIFDHEAKLLAEKVRPKRVMLNMDEVRMGGTCRACRGRNMGELLGECVTRQVEILRKHIPGVEVLVWSDMFDPHHNAHGDYYLVDGDYTGSWNHIPKDLVIAVWGGAPREKSLKFFADRGFKTLVACYYDADDLKDVKGWIDVARPLPGVRGFMYTPWQKKYDLLPAFGDLLKP